MIAQDLTRVQPRDAYARMMRMTKCLYIDGSNLYGGISELLTPGEFVDLSTLFPIINRAFNGVDCIKFYGAYMGLPGLTNARDILFAKAQNEFFNSAIARKVYFGKGYISRHGKEKGVDMQLGVDMVHDAHSGLFNEMILLSGDADFLYPIQYVKNAGKKVHYCAFATRFTFPIAFRSNEKVVLDMHKYFETKVKPVAKRLPPGLQIHNIDADIKIKNA